MECCSTRRVGPDSEGCARHVHRRRSANDTVGEIQSGWEQWIDTPCLGCSIGDRRRHSHHGIPTGQGLIFWVVVQNNTRLKDGDVEGMRCGTACCICINREHRRGHVHRWRTRKNTINKVQSCWNRWMDAPCLSVSTSDCWIQCGHGNASNQREVLWIVIQCNDWLKDGDVDLSTR